MCAEEIFIEDSKPAGGDLLHIFNVVYGLIFLSAENSVRVAHRLFKNTYRDFLHF